MSLRKCVPFLAGYPFEDPLCRVTRMNVSRIVNVHGAPEFDLGLNIKISFYTLVF